MKTKHTKGEWIAKAERIHKTVRPYRVYQGTKIICELKSYDRYNNEANEEEKSNAKLIAAAPDLLDALLSLQSRIEECGDDPITVKEMYDSFYQELVESAIEKATK